MLLADSADNYLGYYLAAVGVMIVCGMIGYSVRVSKGNEGAGFALGLLFGPIGIVISLLLPDQNRKREREREENEARQISVKQIELLQAQLDELKSIKSGKRLYQADIGRISLPTPPADRADFSGQWIRVASNGEDLGDMTIAEVRRALMERRMDLGDFYLEPQRNEWLPLADHPQL